MYGHSQDIENGSLKHGSAVMECNLLKSIKAYTTDQAEGEAKLQE